MQNYTFSPQPSRVLNYLSCCPSYKPTPIIEINNFTSTNVLAKDETNRMGLGSFKALGGVYAVFRLVKSAWEKEYGQPLSTKNIMDPSVKEFAKNIIFVCASAGNHGLSVAAGAKIFGAKARIHLSNNVPNKFSKALKNKGAEVIWSGDVYEQSMLAAVQDAKLSNAILLADSSWSNYFEAPSLVMEGYTVLAEEMRSKFEATNQWPTHVILQAGVGGLAAAVAYMIRQNWKEQPEIIVVEPEGAACLHESDKAGRLVKVKGTISNMGRLDCKEASMIAFEALKKCDVQYATISDEEAQEAADRLVKNDIITTPSGAAGAALVEKLNLSSQALPLIIISEGTAH